MRIILNCIPLKSGGGVQVGLDFLRQVKDLGERHEWFLVATKGTPIAEIRESKNLHLLKIVSNSTVSRLWFEYVGCRKLISTIGATVVYTQFGPPWPGARCLNIVGCAYSNLFYPEIDFWGRLHFPQRVGRACIDVLRMSRMRQADHIIFETEDLAQRAVRLMKFPRERVSWVKPSVSSLVSPSKDHGDTHERCRALPAGFRVLLLSTYNPNKNIDLLPHIAKALSERSAGHDIYFVVTLPHDSEHTNRILTEAQKLGVQDRIINLGPIPHEGCAEVYRVCNLVILPSQLESFSNTIAEAWTMDRPLLISDLAWARSLCGTGAAYYKYRDPYDAAGQILKLRHDRGHYDALIAQGRGMLNSYPKPSERFKQYLSIIEEYAPGLKS